MSYNYFRLDEPKPTLTFHQLLIALKGHQKELCWIQFTQEDLEAFLKRKVEMNKTSFDLEGGVKPVVEEVELPF